MTIDYFNAEFVESYLNNELPAEDKVKFEIELQTNKELSDFVSLYNDVDSAIFEQDVMELRNNLNSIYEIASEEWIEETPMLLTEPHKDEIDDAIAQEDVMALRSMLNDIHDLHQDELHSSEILSEEESLNLEEIVNETEDLLESDIYQAIMEDDVMELRSKLDDIREEVELPTKRKPFLHRVTKLTAVASIALIVILGATSWYAIDSKPMNPEKAVDKYFKPIEPMPQKRGVSQDELMRMMRSAHDKYAEANYLGAIDEFKDYLIERDKEKPDLSVTTYIGCCYLETGQYDKAQRQFEIVYANKGSALIEEAEWYLAGCYLRHKDLKTEAVKMLKEMVMAPDHKYKENSRKLLKKLKI